MVKKFHIPNFHSSFLMLITGLTSTCANESLGPLGVARGKLFDSTEWINLINTHGENVLKRDFIIELLKFLFLYHSQNRQQPQFPHLE